MSRRFAKPSLAFTILIACGLLGCGHDGPERHAVQGGVLFDGQPLEAGQIRFVPTGETKGPAAVATISQGFYELPRRVGPVAGKHRIEIEGQIAPSFEIDDEQAYARVHAETKGKPLPPQPIPPKYNAKSTLIADVSNDDSANKLDFDLSLTSRSKPAK
jgi:hypothetical protein